MIQDLLAIKETENDHLVLSFRQWPKEISKWLKLTWRNKCIQSFLIKCLNKVTAAKFVVAQISRIHWPCILHGNPERSKRHPRFELVCIELEGHFPSTQLWSTYNMPSTYATWPHRFIYSWSNINRLKDTAVLFILSFLSSIIRPRCWIRSHCSARTVEGQPSKGWCLKSWKTCDPFTLRHQILGISHPQWDV